MGWQDAPLVQAVDTAPTGSAPEPAWMNAPVVGSSKEPARPTGPQQLAGAASLLTQHPLTAGIGMAENMLSGVGAGVGSLAEAVTGSDPGTYSQAWSYEPRTQAGQRIAELSANEGAQIGRVYDRVAGTGPLAQTLKERIPQAAAAVGTVTGAAATPRLLRGGAPRAMPPRTAEEVVSRLDTQQSMGAASAAPSLVNVSPELRQAIVSKAQSAGGAINPDVLARHVEADTLPVRMRLTEGQATQDPVIISNEMNSRLQNPELAQHFDGQNRQLAQNLQAIRDEVGPDVFSTNVVEHGDTLINAYKAVDAAREAEISAAYDALLRAAGGRQFPIGAKTLLDKASTELHKQLIFDHAPRSVMNALKAFAAKPGTMTFENFEALRTNLATIQRTATDGLERRAAGIIRKEMEELPLVSGAAKMKPLADQARKLARERFEALEADPAYKAAVEESVPPDRFVQRFVVGGTRDNVARMRATIGSDEAAAQTMSVAVLDYLRDVARLNPHYEGNFAAASFNKALTGLSPKMQALLAPEFAEQLERLGSVARYTTFQPRGSAVNNSNTFVAGAAEYVASAAEGAANVGAAGVPVGTWARKAYSRRQQRREAQRAIEPGAGLDRLDEAPSRVQ